ncbi:MAG: hypothetical protein H6703_10310 [Myxococcales bacterium]|nr:hypothetical protein [Myxococcales bacterium]
MQLGEAQQRDRLGGVVFEDGVEQAAGGVDLADRGPRLGGLQGERAAMTSPAAARAARSAAAAKAQASPESAAATASPRAAVASSRTKSSACRKHTRAASGSLNRIR